jgi:hypothetical protein
MLDMPPPGAELWADATAAARWAESISARVNRDGAWPPDLCPTRARAGAEHAAALIVERRQHGISTTQVLPASIFAGPELRPFATSPNSWPD